LKKVSSYRADPGVLYAEPDYVVQADETPTDPRWNQQWDMMKISAPAAWSTQTDSSSVVVAIIDSGIDFTHPDLQANLWVNSDGSHGFNCIRARGPSAPWRTTESGIAGLSWKSDQSRNS
jgi:subtilisin family serine protease